VILLSLSNLLELVSRLVVLYVLTEYVSLEYYGTYSYSIVVAQFLVFVSMLGLGPAQIRFSILSNQSKIQAQLYSYISGIAVSIFLIFFGDSLLLGMYIYYYYLNYFSYYYTAEGNPENIAPFRLVVNLLLMVSIILWHDEYLSITYFFVGYFMLLIGYVAIRDKIYTLGGGLLEHISYIFNMYISQVAAVGQRFGERNIFLTILSPTSFGIYSVVRDLVNAVCYVAYFPLQTFIIKNIVSSIHNKSGVGGYIKKFGIYMLLLTVFGVVGICGVIYFRDYISIVTDSSLVNSILFVPLWLTLMLVLMEVFIKFTMMFHDSYGVPIRNSLGQMSILLTLIIIVGAGAYSNLDSIFLICLSYVPFCIYSAWFYLKVWNNENINIKSS